MKANHLLALAILAICLQYGTAVDRKSLFLLPTANNGQACNATSEATICSVTGTICGYHNECPKCVCDASKYDIVVTKAADSSEMCTNKVWIDGACTEDGECPTGATCSTNKCACTAPKVASTDKTACVDAPKKAIGASCTAASTDECGKHTEACPADPNNNCKCAANAVADSNNIDCVTKLDTPCNPSAGPPCSAGFFCKESAGGDTTVGLCKACPASCATCATAATATDDQTKCATCPAGKYLVDTAETCTGTVLTFGADCSSATTPKTANDQCESNSECATTCKCPTDTTWNVLSGKKFCVKTAKVNETCTTDQTTIAAQLQLTTPVNPTASSIVCDAGLNCVDNCQDMAKKCATPYSLAVGGEAGQLVMNIALTITSLAMAIFLF